MADWHYAFLFYFVSPKESVQRMKLHLQLSYQYSKISYENTRLHEKKTLYSTQRYLGLK